MSPLWKRLKHPLTYLLLVGVAGIALAIDGLRSPQKQIASRIYVDSVRVYQRVGSPVLSRYVRCRYTPTCSRYSVAAVEKYGLGKGLRLTASRLWRCRASVPLGTPDPLP